MAESSTQPRLTPLVGPIEIEQNHAFNHWWVIDYWDTASGGNLPSYMAGEFITVDNAIEGLQAGWEGITPWYDGVLYLPLNVAYGTSSTNCVWFQFDIQFVQPGLGWPFPNSITWYIWDIRGPGTNIPDDYHSTPVGINYVVGHEYWFALMTSGTNTVTFYIQDLTSGASWSKSDWRWTVPSINMLADEGMFSPASAIEGYTTSTVLSSVPFFQTRVGEQVTVNRQRSLGPVPSGITTNRIVIGTYDLWYWMMLTPGSLPVPSISSVDYPSIIGVGQSATIDATVTNDGGPASWQTISISFPSTEDISSISIIQTDLSSSAIHAAGETVDAAYSTTTISLQNYLAEGSSNWQTGVSHHLKISVTPDGIGSFRFYVKSVAAASNWACNWDPKTGEKDRQLEFVKTHTIAVGVNPSSISIDIDPTQIFLGGGTTISGTISSSILGDLSGTVYLQYSTDNTNWNSIGSTSSTPSGAYYYWWTPLSAGSFYVRSYWNGNGNYGGATSSSVTLAVASGAGNLGDHTMCKDVQPDEPWNPIERTNAFFTDDYAAYSWLHFVGPVYGSHTVRWDWYDPDGWNLGSSTYVIPDAADYGYDYWNWYRCSVGVLIDGYQAWYSSRLGRSFETKVYYDGAWVVTETWQVIKHGSSITISLSSNTIICGQSVTVSSQVSPSFSDGTITLQYSLDSIDWSNIASGTPSSGYYSSIWTPPTATAYCVRATWSGNPDYDSSTSSTLILTVNKASTSLTTSLSSATITYEASVTITASLSPVLQGKPVIIQFSLEGSTWYYLSSGTTNSGGLYSYSWAPDAGGYYLRSTWSGDTNYHGATSPSQQLTVNKASTSTSCTLSSNSIEYGASVDVTGTVSVPVDTGTMTLEYSVDGTTWDIISADTPASASFSSAWNPPEVGIFYVRAKWSGDYNYLGSTSSSQTLMVSGYELTINVVGGGTTNPTPGSHWYGEGRVVSVDAIPDSRWVLDHWELDTVDVGSADPYDVTMSSNHDLMAVFVEAPFGWEVTLTASLDIYSDQSTLGVRSDATNGFDVAYDEIDPPAPPTGVVSYFYCPLNPTSPVNLQKLSTSMIPPSLPLYWTYMVRSIGLSGVVTISWGASEIANIPAEYPVYLGFSDGSSINMRTNTEYIFTGEDNAIYTFTVIVGNVRFDLALLPGWNMVSFPALPQNPSFSAVFSGLSFYQVLTWDGASYVTQAVAEAGKGYWVLVLEAATVTVIGTPVESYELDLPAGWSMIGSIYQCTVDADLVFPSAYQMLTWNGASYVPSTSIEPGKGYWALVFEPTHIVVDESKAETLELSGSLESLAESQAAISPWDVTLTASLDIYSDESKFGVRNDATNGFDAACDQVDPPLPPTGVGSYFYYPTNPTSPVNLQKLSTSMIPLADSMNWTYILRPVGIAGEAYISWSASEIAAIPAEYIVQLVCPGGVIINMRSTTQYSFTAAADTSYTFTIQICSSGYLVVRGAHDEIYYRLYNYTTGSWEDWRVIPDGATCDSPAAMAYSGKLYFVVRGMDGQSLWFGSVNLTDYSFSGWTLLSGASPSAPTLVGYGSGLVLVVRGFTNIIYYRSYDCVSETWTEWVPVPEGTTCDSPAAAVLGTDLHLVVRGFSTTDVWGNNTLWHGVVNLADDSFSGWAPLEGWTPSAPRLAASEALNELYLAVRGGDSRIWINTWNGAVWEGWAALPDGATCDSPALTVINGELHIVVRCITGTALWHYYINLSTEDHSGWTLMDGWTPSAPTLAG